MQAGLRYSSPHLTIGAISTIRSGLLSEAWLVSLGQGLKQYPAVGNPKEA